MSSLDLGLIGNCGFAALVDRQGSIVWCCLPRFDGDPVFNALLQPVAPDGQPAAGQGIFAVELEDLRSAEQAYVRNTAILRTVLISPKGSIEIIDFAPRFTLLGRSFHPQTLIRRIRVLAGAPRARIRVRPTFNYGAETPRTTRASNHIRFTGEDQTIRLTTDAPLDYVMGETVFTLRGTLNFILSADESLAQSAAEVAGSFEGRTANYWREWVHRLAVPFEWQDEVIRAAITLKLCTYESTGAIIAAVTTSIPEAPGSARNWDYRFCWLRDAFFVVRALNSLSAVRTLENYFQWLMNVVTTADENGVQPVLGVGLETELTERQVASLSGYRGMGPVRVGNGAYTQHQHDAYGNIILGSCQAFFDHRLLNPPGYDDFLRLEAMGRHALRLYDKPDAGMWEYRTRASVHTTSSLMCWAAADRLARIAVRFRDEPRTAFWQRSAAEIREVILTRAWSQKRGSFVDSFEGENLDAGLLLMLELGFIGADDPRMVATVAAIEKALGRGPFLLRYEAPDDFGAPETTFNICAFWRVDALARMGRIEEAREHFTALLAKRNSLGLMSEDSDPESGEMWGNFPQTYSMVGIINCAMRLSQPWEKAL